MYNPHASQLNDKYKERLRTTVGFQNDVGIGGTLYSCRSGFEGLDPGRC
jgi:hypothetical protein